MSRAETAGFTASAWLENDGARDFSQRAAANHWPQSDPVQLLSGVAVFHIRPEQPWISETRCTPATLVVFAQPPPDALRAQIARAGCRVISPQSLTQTGSLALSFGPSGWRSLSARKVTGERLWNQRR